MSVYQRFFRFTDGPLIDEIDQLFEARIAAGKLYKELADKYGAYAAHSYEVSGAFAGFKFEKGSEPDKATFRFVAKHRLWLPRKNVPSGKAVWAEIDQLPKPKPIESVLSQVGLCTGFPDVWSGGKGYAPSIWGYGAPRNIWFVSVPWKDIDPEKLAKYKKDKDEAMLTRPNSELDSFLWTPPENWVEVKRWQIEKEVEEIQAESKDSSQ